MSVGDLYDVERTGEFAVTRVRRRSKQAKLDAAPSEATRTDATRRVPITVLTDDATLADSIHDAAAASHPVATTTLREHHGPCEELTRHPLPTSRSTLSASTPKCTSSPLRRA